MKHTTIRKIIGMRIKELRLEQDITQEHFAVITGLNRSYLADIEKGNRNFGMDTLATIIDGFGISFEEFFKDIC